MGTELVGKSNKTEYSTPPKIVEPLIKEFNITRDVCASLENYKLPDYWTKKDNALALTWEGNCWMNPPFGRDLRKWVKKAYSEASNGTKVCLIPVRSNTKWWSEVAPKAEIRFINGEVNFNNQPRGLWLPMCIMIFGEQAKTGTFSIIDYR